MKYQLKDIIDYTISLINEFARQYNLTDQQAYRYLKFHKGISFIEQHYGVIHTLDFKEAIDSVAMYCRKTGGIL